MTVQPFKTIVLDLLHQGHLDEEAFVQELSETERSAIGTWKHWSAKDHVAHTTFWHQELVLKLTAILQHQESPSGKEDEEQLNSNVFEEQQQRPWSAIHAESERVYAELIKLAEQLSEEDLTTSKRFTSISGERPLYTAFLGSCYEHDQEHRAQYYVDHHNLPRAIEIREQCVSRIMQAEVPEWVKGSFLYNLACFYTQQSQLEKAATLLQEALTLAPRLKERSQSDPDLAALRDQKQGSMKTFQANGRTINAYLAVPEQGSGPGVLVLHAWWGLTNVFKQVCDRLAREGFIALAPDLYHGTTTTSIEEAEQLASAHIESEETARDLTTSIDYLLHQSGRSGKALGAIGFSLGGFWALEHSDQLNAIVTFYSTTSPEKIKAETSIQGHFAEHDDFEPAEQVHQFEEALRSSGKHTSFFTYPGTHHWFFEENRPEYDAEAAHLAWQRTIEFLHQQLD